MNHAMPVHENNAPTPEKWALLIGINNYRYGNPPVFPNLNGCLNDVDDIGSLLIDKFGFPANHLTFLKDEQATRAGILEAMRAHLVEKAEPGDIVVVYYSGHGSEAPDLLRLNGIAQTIVPHDGRDPEGNVGDIQGSDLNNALAGLKTSNSTFILDSCYSGSLRARYTCVPRCIPPDPHLLRTAESSKAVSSLSAAPLRLPGSTYALLAACAPNELSFEALVDGRHRGLFTYRFCNVLRNSAQPLTFRDLMDTLPGLILGEHSRQHPQLSGTSDDQYVFGQGRVPVRPYVLITPGGPAGVSFSGGREYGITVGSIYDVYQPASKQLGFPYPPIATVEVVRSDDFGADGRVISGGPVPDGARAVERTPGYEGMIVPVATYGPGNSESLRKLREELSSLPYFRVTEETDGAELIVAESEDGLRIGLPGIIASGPLIPAGDAAVIEAVRQIRHWLHWMSLRRLTNRTTNLRVEFTIAPQDPSSGYVSGGGLHCIVRNMSNEDLYISILDFADDGTIQVIYPIDEVPTLYSGESLTKTFHLEEHLGRNSGRDTLKVIASTFQRDYRMFVSTLGTSKGLQPVPQGDWIALDQILVWHAPAQPVDKLQTVTSKRT